ncbi:DUF6708 domain-containing protein, partial [Gilliamella sp. Pas-s27]|uniref:DUF6708 domain-containing protein n=1 Tax=Gilliamella sp. Pas-s27 TaxID=2687311 RepID=UPI0013663696
IFYACLYFIVTILGSILTVGSCTFIMDYDHPDSGSMLCFIGIVCFISCCLTMYYAVPQLYHYLFSHLGSPIIFNRKTGKVYVNESYFFNFKVLRHPA